MKTALQENGFEIIEDVYSEKEVNEILQILVPKKLEYKFGVREFLVSNPEITERVFTKKLLSIIKKVSPNTNKSVKSIYFDKPPSANWTVNWHQDLTINVREKSETANFKNWRVNNERTVVQPSLEILKSMFTVRIHLDDCTQENGALRVIENSHTHGVINIKEWIKEKQGVERICEVRKGGIVMMKPLTLHSSRRTENHTRRRVIHIEFCDQELPKGLEWKEKINVRL